LLESFSADAASSASALNAFAKLLETHIRFEERMLFPHIEQLASEAMLEQAGKKLQKEAPVTKSDWPDSFWIE
jgi:hemerythrin-like domain-containing protein